MGASRQYIGNFGVTAPAGDIPFRASLESPQGDVKIETTRRFKSDLIKIGKDLKLDSESILRDRFGSVIGRFKLDKGLIIIATTPNLAANTYQDLRPNFELLAELVTKDRQQVLVDEYIHGYIDRKAAIKNRSGQSSQERLDREEDISKDETLSYFAKTTLLIVFLNLFLGTLVLIWQQNRRFWESVNSPNRSKSRTAKRISKH